MKRIQVGIPGFDELTEGGLPENTVNLISGPTGSAKTLFGFQYVYNGARRFNDTGIYLTLEESRGNIERAMKNYDMSVEDLEKDKKLFIIDMGKLRSECEIDEELEWNLISFKTLTEFLESHLKFSNAKRLTIDSLTALGLYYPSIEELRREMFKFSRFLKEKNLTSVLITETIDDHPTRYGIEEFIADSLISLGYENVEGEYRRTLTIRKMRFTKHDPLKHPFLIMSSGMEISPDEVLV